MEAMLVKYFFSWVVLRRALEQDEEHEDRNAKLFPRRIRALPPAHVVIHLPSLLPWQRCGCSILVCLVYCISLWT